MRLPLAVPFAAWLTMVPAPGPAAPPPSPGPVVARLPDGLDVKTEVERLARTRGMKQAAVIAAVGSVKRATIRFAESKDGTVVPGMAEVVSLTGTVTDGVAHLHVALAPADGRVVGGHLLTGTPSNGVEVVLIAVQK